MEKDIEVQVGQKGLYKSHLENIRRLSTQNERIRQTI